VPIAMENEWGFSLIGDRWASTESAMIRALPQRKDQHRAFPNLVGRIVSPRRSQRPQREPLMQERPESQEEMYTIVLCCHSLELRKLEGLPCVLGALCGQLQRSGLYHLVVCVVIHR
jgi:hypothetical protein